MIDVNQIKPLLYDTRFGASGQLVSDCPYCNKKGHFYLSTKSLLWICHKCGEAGNVFQLLRQLNALHLIEGAKVDTTKHLKSLAEMTKVEEELETLLKPVQLPVGFTTLQWDDDNIYTQYLKSRKYTEEDFLIYQPGYTDLLEKFEGYVIIPINQAWQPRAFLARNIFDDDRLRYQNQKGVKFNALLDGIDSCTSGTRTLIIGEGHFDKISITNELRLYEDDEIKACQSFGKKLSALQIEAILKTNVENLYLFYDARDAVRSIKQFGNKFKNRLNVFGCFERTKADAGQMNADQILKVLYKAKPIENYTYSVVQFNQLK